MEALDANHDGVIDENEIANASAALKALDKNGDGKLTQDELRPPRPAGGDRQGPPPGPDGQAPQRPRPNY
jgi:Ca2+-binding EF-hand superfamily protein